MNRKFMCQNKEGAHFNCCCRVLNDIHTLQTTIESFTHKINVHMRIWYILTWTMLMDDNVYVHLDNDIEKNLMCICLLHRYETVHTEFIYLLLRIYLLYWNTVTFHVADILHPWIFTQLGLHRQFIKILFSSGETHRKQYEFPQKLVSVRDVQYRKRTEYMCLVNAKKIGMSHHTHFA